MARPQSTHIQLELDLPSDAPRPSAAALLMTGAQRKRGAAVGWHGITPALIEIDWRLASELSPEGHAVKVLVAARSPARKAGLRTGDYVVSVSPSPTENLSLTDFDALSLPSGSEVFVKFHRPGRERVRDIQTTVVRLREQPKVPKAPRWQQIPRVAYGPEVRPDERKRFVAEMAVHPHMKALGHRILVRLLMHYDGENGIYPSYRTIARDVNCRRKETAMEQIARLSWLGVIEVLKGAGIKTKSGPTNRFIIHWPQGWGASVVKLTASK